MKTLEIKRITLDNLKDDRDVKIRFGPEEEPVVENKVKKKFKKKPYGGRINKSGYKFISVTRQWSVSDQKYHWSYRIRIQQDKKEITKCFRMTPDPKLDCEPKFFPYDKYPVPQHVIDYRNKHYFLYS